MKSFLSQLTINAIWIDKLRELTPRLFEKEFQGEKFLFGDLKEDHGLKDAEIKKLAAHFHKMFHLKEGKKEYSLLQYREAADWLLSIHAGANDCSLPMSFFSAENQETLKSYTFRKEHLIQEIEVWADMLQPRGFIWRWVSLQEIYGFLFGALLPDREKLVVFDGRLKGFKQFQVEAEATDWLIGHPAFFAELLKAKISVPQGMLALSSTRPLDGSIGKLLVKKGLNVTEIYGNKETAGIGYREFPNKNFRLLPFWRQEDGEIHRLGATNFDAQFPMNQLHWKDSRTFSLKTQNHKVVRIGGEQVEPFTVAKKLKRIDGVEKAWVRKMGNKEGAHLKVWIKTNLPELAWDDLRSRSFSWVETHLSTLEKPRHLVISNEAPLNEMGKIKNWEIDLEAGLVE